MTGRSFADLVNFTPAFDVLIQEFGHDCSLVFGRVWRYSQGEQGVCTASVQTIADSLRMSRTSVIAHLNELTEAGYLAKETRRGIGCRYAPSSAVDAGEATSPKRGLVPVQNEDSYQSKMRTQRYKPKIQAKQTNRAAALRTEQAENRFGSEQFKFALKHASALPQVDRPESYAVALLEQGVRFHEDGSKFRGRRRAPAPAKLCAGCGQVPDYCLCEEE